MGTDPQLVKALLSRLKGADAVALMAVPVARPGRRTDLRATSRRAGDRSRTPRTDTRLRTVLAGPAPIRKAFEGGALGRMHAERLVAYAKAQPNCPRLTAMVSELAKAPPKGSPELPKFKRTLSKRIEHLLEETSSSCASDQGPPRAPDSARIAESLEEAQAGWVTPAGPIVKLPGMHRGDRPSPSPKKNQRDPPTTPATDENGPGCEAAASAAERAAFGELMSAWLRFVDITRGDLHSCVLIELFFDVESGLREPLDDELYTWMSLHLRAQRLARELGEAFDGYDDLRAMAMGNKDVDQALIDRAAGEIALRAEAQMPLDAIPPVKSRRSRQATPRITAS